MLTLTSFKVFTIYLVVFAFSFLGYINSFFGVLFFVLLVGVFTYLTLQKLEWGMYLMFAELFVGSFGYWFSIYGISIRIAFFLVFWAVVLFRILQERNNFQFFPAQQEIASVNQYHSRNWSNLNFRYWSFVLLFLWLLVSFVRGIAAHEFSNASFDFNGFIVLTLCLPLLWERRTLAAAGPVFGAHDDASLPAGSVMAQREPFVRVESANMFTLMQGAVGFLFFLSAGIEVIFSRFGFVDVLYTFIRDLRIGEITLLYQNMVRVFIQSQMYVVVGVVFATLAVLFAQKSNKSASNYELRITNYGFLFLCITTLLISGSRSFWLGTVVSLLALMVLAIRHFVICHLSFVIILKRLLALVGTALASILFIMFLAGVGFGGQKDVLHNRLSMGEAAASSRSAQAGPLWYAILQAPFVGHGFGKTVTYVSHDPRAIATSGGSGEVTTAAFELGWMDIALKTGVIGVVLYLWFIVQLMFALWKKVFESRGEINPVICYSPFVIRCLTLFFSLLALVTIHFFTPYLNHPLGIGIILLALVALREKRQYSEGENSKFGAPNPK